MGLMSYSEASSYSYLITNDPSPPPPQPKFYSITLDVLIEGMRLTQPTNVLGDGRRVPEIDPEMTRLMTLGVIVKGSGDVVSAEQAIAVTAVLDNLPAAWASATDRRSLMEVGLLAR